MTELLTAAQMRAIEEAAIGSGEVTGLELMERAGRGVVQAIFEEWPELAKTVHRAVVLCGPGNNGGDGFVVARILSEWGWEVEVFLFGDPGKLPPDARANHERWRAIGDVRKAGELTRDRLLDADIRVDAVFGTGLARPLAGEVLDFCELIHAAGPNVCIDLPSGFCADSGRPVTERAREDWGPETAPLVVTFQTLKLGHVLGRCAEVAGTVRIVDIGLHDRLSRTGARDVARLTEAGCGTATAKNGHGHKYAHGHALILSGPASRTGAARLAARGALRIGAGLVTVAAPPDAIPEHAAQLTAIMLREVGDAKALTELLSDRRLNALCLGPGMGTGDPARKMVKAALAARRGTVLDADALTAFAEDPDALFGMLHEGCVLTPHGGEFARLFHDIYQRLAEPAATGPAYSKADAARDAAARAGCVVLFKGADTVFADPAGNCLVNSAHYERSTPWLATAGAGDVLAGFIAGLLARGIAPLDAAAAAAWLHVECALSFGPGLIAEDIPEELPKVFQRLGI